MNDEKKAPARESLVELAHRVEAEEAASTGVGPRRALDAKRDIPITERQAAAKIRRLRDQAGMTQGELGDAVGLGRVAVMHLENGRRGISLSEAVDFARILNISLAELVGEETPTPNAVVVDREETTIPNGVVIDRELAMNMMSALLQGMRDDMGRSR